MLGRLLGDPYWPPQQNTSPLVTAAQLMMPPAETAVAFPLKPGTSIGTELLTPVPLPSWLNRLFHP